MTDNAWWDDDADLRLEISYVKNVSDGLHYVVTIKSPNYMSMNLEREESFKTRKEAEKFAYKYMKKKVV
jgi:hypothetical protein